jgi:hypothetical protein
MWISWIFRSSHQPKKCREVSSGPSHNESTSAFRAARSLVLERESRADSINSYRASVFLRTVKVSYNRKERFSQTIQVPVALLLSLALDIVLFIISSAVYGWARNSRIAKVLDQKRTPHRKVCELDCTGTHCCTAAARHAVFCDLGMAVDVDRSSLIVISAKDEARKHVRDCSVVDKSRFRSLTR